MKTYILLLLGLTSLTTNLAAQEATCSDTLSSKQLQSKTEESVKIEYYSVEKEQKRISISDVNSLISSDDITLSSISKDQFIFASSLIHQLGLTKDSVLQFQVESQSIPTCIDFSYPALKKRIIPFAKIERTQLETRQQVIADSVRIVTAALDREQKMIENAKNDHESNVAAYEVSKKEFYQKYSAHKGQIDELFSKSNTIDEMLEDFKAGKSLSTKDREKIVETTNAILELKNEVNSVMNGFTTDYDQLHNSSVRLLSFEANVDTLKKMISTSKQTLKRFETEQKYITKRLAVLKRILS